MDGDIIGTHRQFHQPKDVKYGVRATHNDRIGLKKYPFFFFDFWPKPSRFDILVDLSKDT